MDCVKALDVLETLPFIDADKLFVRGTSQGGALGMAVSALDERVKLAVVNVPSNSNIEYRVEHRHGSFTSVNDYLRRHPDNLERAYETLSYFDTMNLAHRIKAKVRMYTGLMDTICPPSSQFAAYNKITSEKDVVIYPDYAHEGYPGMGEDVMTFMLAMK
jgi:cephalosporin-C deacetylase